MRYDGVSGLEIEYMGCVIPNGESREWWQEYNAELQRLALAEPADWIPGLRWRSREELFEQALSRSSLVDSELRAKLPRDAWLVAPAEASDALLVIAAEELLVIQRGQDPFRTLMVHRLARVQRERAWASLGPEGRARISALRELERAEEELRLGCLRAREGHRVDRRADEEQRRAESSARAKAIAVRATAVSVLLATRALPCPKCGIREQGFRQLTGGYFVCPRCARSSPATDFSDG